MREWGAFSVLVMAAWLMRATVRAAYLRVKRSVDERVPDDLPLGAGEWLREYDRENGLGLRVYAGAPGTSEVDSYLPSAHVITLSRDVYVKKDPSFWAIAAHELGHAIVYRSTPLVAAPLQIGRLVLASATSLATTLIFANVLYARRDLDAIAFALLHASLVGYVLLLVDEALASAVGLRILRRDPRVDRRGRNAAYVALGAAFLTYVAGFVGQVLLVAQRAIVLAQIERHRHFVPGAPIAGARLAFVAASSVVLLVLVARALRASLRSRANLTPAALEESRVTLRKADLVRGVIACAIVALVYDAPGAPYLPWICAAGVLASRAFVHALRAIFSGLVSAVVSVALLPVLVLVALGRRGRRDPTAADPNVVPSPLPATGTPAGPLDALPLPQAIDDWEIEGYRNASWYERVGELAFPLLHAAFVVGVLVEVVR